VVVLPIPKVDDDGGSLFAVVTARQQAAAAVVIAIPFIDIFYICHTIIVLCIALFYIDWPSISSTTHLFEIMSTSTRPAAIFY